MCLKLNSLEPKIADKDIICYKRVKRTKIKGIYKSSFTRFEYIIIRLYTNNLNIKCVNNIIKCFKSQYLRTSNYFIEEGMFHSYKKFIPPLSLISPNYVALKCIIPKGAYYFEGNLNSIPCYASSQIKILEEIKFNRLYGKII